MKILLFGREGQVGWELRPLLERRGDVLAPSRAEADIGDVEGLRRFLLRERPRIIVNATAYNEVDRAESEPDAALRINRDAVAVLGEHGKHHGAALIHYSTDFVFDGLKGAPYVETDPTNPLSAYGRSKRAGEEALLGLEAPALVLRTAWVYSTRRKSFVSAILKLARERKELKVVSDQTGNPTFCRDLAEATARLFDALGKDPVGAAAEYRGIYHAAGRGACSRYELAQAILELDPKRPEHVAERIEPVTSDAFPAPARRPSFAPLDCGKLERRFGITLPPWRDALARALTARAAGE
jgi:dTDP-4-dehydrorhamnose reductase